MNKKIIAILLVVLFIIDIVAAALLFINIQILTFPETTVRVDVVEINTEPTAISQYVDETILGKAAVILPQLVEKLIE